MNDTRRSLRGRLAPSPTGAQHVGNARTFLVAWLDARSDGGELWLRIEDLDTPRTKAGAAEQAVEDLRWLGLDWDRMAPLQTDRGTRYAEVLATLRSRGWVYPCTCTRSEIESSASAPHEGHLDGVRYPGTCSSKEASDAEALDRQGTRYAWRFRMPPGEMRWTDRLFGPQALDAQRDLGDFVVARNYGPVAYQLAVVVDDWDQGITSIVRGNDLMFSTYRQRALLSALNWSSPDYLHVPLVVGPDGKRLAKRHGDTRLATLREQNVAPESLVGRLAHSLGLIEAPEPLSPRELLAVVLQRPSWRENLTRDAWTLTFE